MAVGVGRDGSSIGLVGDFVPLVLVKAEFLEDDGFGASRV